jgi:hemerythrin-like metal-binding protein
MAFIEWTEECSVGVQQFDDDHKKLFTMANELYDSVLSGNARNALSNALDRLGAYTKEHHQREEDAFARTDYPDASAHKGQHEIAKMMFADIRNNMSRAENGQLSMELAKILKGWLLMHIQTEDKKFGAFLNSRDIR